MILSFVIMFLIFGITTINAWVRCKYISKLIKNSDDLDEIDILNRILRKSKFIYLYVLLGTLSMLILIIYSVWKFI